jgi:3-oxoacyl-[acyl-carrier protein] reductase
MELGLVDKVALVGGGDRGLGRAAAEVLATEGAAVAISARRVDALAVAAEQIAQRTGARVVPIAADVISVADCERVVEGTVAESGVSMCS